MLRWGRAHPDRLVVGLDASADGMRGSARRAKDLSNVVFVVAAAESLPDDLAGLADRVTVQFPWGSLLRGVMGVDGPVLENLARIAAPGATLTVLWSVVDRDRAAVGPTPTWPAEERFAAVGFDVHELRQASAEEVASTGSTWAKRLRAGIDRPVTLLRAVRR